MNLLRIRIFFVFLRTWPLYIFLCLKLKLFKSKYAFLWVEDINKIKYQGFFRLITERPYYRELLYHRLRLPVSICRPLFGYYPISIGRVFIGPGLILEHPHGSHLNAKAIGKNFTCLHNVTLGKNHNGIPTIGNNVFIGCGSAVLGDITIGDNVNIGANCVVLRDLPDNCTVIGNPAIIVKKDGLKVNIPL